MCGIIVAAQRSHVLASAMLMVYLFGGVGVLVSGGRSRARASVRARILVRVWIGICRARGSSCSDCWVIRVVILLHVVLSRRMRLCSDLFIEC